MNPEIFARLYAVDWESLEHSYGPADDIPVAVQDLILGTWRTRNEARTFLRHSLNHQGVQRWEATARTIPFLIEFLTDPYVPERHLILEVLTDFAVGKTQGVYMVMGFDLDKAYGPAGTCEYGQVKFPHIKGNPDDLAYGMLMRDIYGAVLKGLPIYLNFLQDGLKEIRVYAAFLLGWLPTVAAQSIPALTAQFRRERSPLARGSQALALAYASLADPSFHRIFRADLEAALLKATDTWERYALAISLVHLPDPHPAVKPIVLDALLHPTKRGVNTQANPWTSLADGTWLAQILLKRAPAAWRDDILMAVCNGLAKARHKHDALDMATLLIETLFTPMPYRTGGFEQAIAVEWDALSDMQKFALYSLAYAPLAYHSSHMNLTLFQHGLPVYQERMQAFVEGRGDLTRYQYSTEHVMPPDFFERLEAIEWANMTHGGGRATDMPDMVRALLAPTFLQRYLAYEHLRGTALMGIRFTSTLSLVPFLIEIAANPDTPDREEVFTLLADCAVGNVTGYRTIDADDEYFLAHGFHPDHQFLPPDPDGLCEEYFAGQGNPPEAYEPLLRTIYDAVVAGLPLYLTALHDENPKVRFNVAFLLAWFTDRPAEIVTALTTRLDIEPDADVRASLILALMRVTWFDTSFHADLNTRFQSALPTARNTYERLALQIAVFRLGGDTSVIPALFKAAKKPPNDVFGTAWQATFEREETPILLKFLLLHVPEAGRYSLVKLACNWLIKCDDEMLVEEIGDYLLQTCFPSPEALWYALMEADPPEPYVPLKSLTREQRLILESMLKNELLWDEDDAILEVLDTYSGVKEFLQQKSKP